MENIILRDTVNEIVNYREEKAIDVLGYADNDDMIVVKKLFKPDYFCLKSSAGQGVYLMEYDWIMSYGSPNMNVLADIEYSYDKINWSGLTYERWSERAPMAGFTGHVSSTTIEFTDEHDTVYLRGNNTEHGISIQCESAVTREIMPMRFCLTNYDIPVESEGDLMTLLSYEDELTDIPSGSSLEGLFYLCGISSLKCLAQSGFYVNDESKIADMLSLTSETGTFTIKSGTRDKWMNPDYGLNIPEGWSIVEV